MSDVLSWIGAVAGIGALATSVAAYRRAGTLKAIDLRIEVRTLASATRSLIAEMPALLDRACASRVAVLAATRGLHSGSAKVWDDQVATDRSLAAKLVVSSDQNYAGHSHQALEDELVSLRAVRDEVDAIRSRYVSSLASDDKERDRLKDAATARVPVVT